MDKYVNTNPTKEEMTKQLRLDAALMECVRTLCFSDDVNAAINEILKIIAGFHNADRAYIFELDEERSVVNNTYEWCRENVEPQIDALQGVDIAVIDRWMVQFETKGEFYINSLDAEADKDSDEYEILASQDIDSLMAAPLKLDGKIIGFIGVDNPADNTDTLFLMQSAAAFVVNDIQRRVTLEQKMIGAISQIYTVMRLLNIPKNTQIEFQSNPNVREYVNRPEDADVQIHDAVLAITSKEYVMQMLEFTNLHTLNERMRGQKIISQEFIGTDGHWCRASFIHVSRDDEDNLIQVIYTVRYIDREKQKELEYQRALKKALENQNEVYTEIMNMQSCGLIAVIPEEQKVLMINDVAKKLFDSSHLDQFDIDIDRDFVEKIMSDEKEKLFDNIRKLTEPGESYVCEFMLPSGKDYIYIMTHSKVVVLQNGTKVRISSLTDITEKKKQEQKLIMLSRIDALTGINNRGSGEREIEEMLAEDICGMFCLFDIDKFKSVNDDYGHIVGDKVLIEIAGCLKKCFNNADILMRLGGDEFAVYAIGIDSEEKGEKIIKSLFDEVDKISIPEMGNRGISVSLGAVIRNKGSIENFDCLYQKADSAMYICKKHEGNYHGFYRPEK
ncbi:MAG: diguanylate cyclase [Lachnospiraceae bacterium]|nr:diguanylate cyclase [Lachnospiraceae bacterium]